MSVTVSDLETKYQRDLNRVLDQNDRNTRKRGLQKLLDDLPWKDKNVSGKVLGPYLINSVLPPLLSTISDPVEKCRDLTLDLLDPIVSLYATYLKTDVNKLLELTRKLAERIGDVPFPEPAEEMRLKVVKRLQTIVSVNFSYMEEFKTKGVSCPLIDTVLQALIKSLGDSFADVKRANATLICSTFPLSPITLRQHYKQLLKGLAVNVNHQHSETRSVTLVAILAGLKTMSLEDYQSLMKDSILQILSRLGNDGKPLVRKVLASQCSDFLIHRLKTSKGFIVKMDLEIMVLMLLLVGDEYEEVRAEATKALTAVAAEWNDSIVLLSEATMGQFDENSHIVDGEAELASVSSSVMNVVDDNEIEIPINSKSKVSTLQELVQGNLPELMSIMLVGVDSWTVEGRKRYLRGLERLIVFSEDKLDSRLIRVFSSLSVQIKDDEAELRAATELCCVRLGAQCDPHSVLDILLPGVNGVQSGFNTFQHRTGAIRLLTHTLSGYASTNNSDNNNISRYHENVVNVITRVSACLTNTDLYEFREGIMREALLLLVRTLVQSFPDQCKHTEIQRNLSLSLIYLCGNLPSEDSVVRHFALKVLAALAALCTDASITDEVERNSVFLKSHFQFLFQSIVKVGVNVNPNWSHNSPALSAFEVLINECAREAWARHQEVLSVFILQTKPKQQPAAGSAEANAHSYASQRGEEVIPLVAEVDVRLSLLALLESFIRKATSDYRCSEFIRANSQKIMKDILLENLIWRVGKVEATVRKVALAATYALLNAGADTFENLRAVAGELLPRLVSNLDDSETTPRQITCLCLTACFKKLRDKTGRMGSIGEQVVRELYPKLLARLDDSSDVIRMAICETLGMFFQVAPDEAYSHTTVDYSLDQLFIHLDDPDPNIQRVVGKVLIIMSSLDEALVLKKANSNRTCHRSPAACDGVIVGVEELSSRLSEQPDMFIPWN